MTRSRFNVAATLALVLIAQVAVALPGRQGFDVLSVEDGLSQATVHAIAQDQFGYMWFGTQEGLNRYDGFEFNTFLHDPHDLNSISNDWVWDILVDTQGDIWVATLGGLNRFSYQTGQFKRYLHNPDDPKSISGNDIRELFQDESGRIWVATESHGLNVFDPQSETFRHIRHDPARIDSLSSDNVRSVAQTYDGMIWVATDGGGLNRLEPRSLTINRHELTLTSPSNTVAERLLSVIAPGDGTLWVATYESGIVRYDPAGRRSVQYVTDPADSGSLSSNSIRAMFVDARNELWVGTDGAGINRLDVVTRSFERFNAPDDLVNGDVSRIYQDRGGVMWVGTYGGLNSWNPLLRPFEHYQRAGDEPNQLSENNVHALASDDTGGIWIGSYGGGLDYLNRANGQFKNYRSDPENPHSLSDDRVMALTLDGESGIWIGTLAGGLNYFDFGTGQFRRYRHDEADAQSLTNDGVTTILETTSGEVYVGTYGGGVNRLSADRNAFERIQHGQADPNTLSSDLIVSLLEARDGTLFIGTYGGGMSHYDPQTGQFHSYRHEPDNEASLSSDKAWAIHEDARGNLWVGTQDAGLNVWRAEQREQNQVAFQRYGRRQGLRSKMIYAVHSDAAGAIWMSSNTGVAKLEPGSGFIRHFGLSDGLQSLEFNFAASASNSQGELLFGGINGFNVVDPSSVRTNTNVPPVVITNIYKMNERVDPGRLASDLDTFELDYTDYLVAFEFAALDYTAPTRNEYAYMLEGIDADWLPSTGVRRATYTGLPAGDYVFRVRGSNNDGVWNQEGASLALRVNPPPWQTAWALTAYALAFVGLVLWIVRIQWVRSRRAELIRRTNVKLEKEIAIGVEREKSIEAQKRIAQQYLDVVEVIMVALDQDGRVTLINQKGCKVLGYSESEIVGRCFVTDFVPKPGRAEAELPFGVIDESGYSEARLLTRDHSERIIAWHTAPLPEQDGRPAGTLSSGTDITEVKHLEMQLLQSQKMDALGAIASGVAHDFNNVLASVLGFSELAMTRLEAGSKASQYIQQSLKSIDHGRELINRILSFSRTDDSGHEPVYLQSVLSDAIELLRPAVPLNVKLRSHIDETCEPVLGNASELHQVIMNLGTNACHAMARGTGELRFTLSAFQEAPDHQAIRLSISDSGPGIDPGIMDRIFDPFFTTKEKGKGTGLGLAMAHSTITSMGGTINVESSVGMGTTFEIVLPCCEAIEQSAPDIAMETAAELPAPSASKRSGEETILFVEDDQTLLLLTQTILQEGGYQVIPKDNAEDALKYFWQNRECIDLVLTDQVMQGMTGEELAHEIRGICDAVPILLASGKKDVVAEGVFDAILLKPVGTDELLATVGRALDRRRTATVAEA